MKTPLSLLLLSSFFIASCATTDLSLSESAEQDFYKAESLFADEQYARTAQYLGRFTAKYPYSSYIIPADILRIKAAYINDEFILSETLAARFMDAHPNHSERIYAEYILGMSYFNQSEGSHHEQVFSKKAKASFTALNEREPSNIYAQEVSQHLQILTNRIAEHEMIIGKFYFESELYIGAIKRFIVVKNEFLMTHIAPESLYWLASSYLALGQQKFAEEAITKLAQYFPESHWHEKAKSLL